jgi:hypothetical protein
MNSFSPTRRVAAVSATVFTLSVISAMVDCARAQAAPCGGAAPCPVYVPHATVMAAEPVAVEPTKPSWIFRRSTFTHDPYTGARVAQYVPIEPVEPLDDQRMVTSRYRRSRTNLRGHDGSIETIYEVQNWGNGRGGLDAEWERFHDAWKESILSGGYYNQGPYGYGGPGGGPYGGTFYGGGFGQPGFGFPNYGGPGFGPSGYGIPGYGSPPAYGGPPGGGHHGYDD